MIFLSECDKKILATKHVKNKFSQEINSPPPGKFYLKNYPKNILGKISGITLL